MSIDALGYVLNDETLEVLIKQALNHAKAGADDINNDINEKSFLDLNNYDYFIIDFEYMTLTNTKRISPILNKENNLDRSKINSLAVHKKSFLSAELKKLIG